MSLQKDVQSAAVQKKSTILEALRVDAENLSGKEEAMRLAEGAVNVLRQKHSDCKTIYNRRKELHGLVLNRKNKAASDVTEAIAAEEHDRIVEHLEKISRLSTTIEQSFYHNVIRYARKVSQYESRLRASDAEARTCTTAMKTVQESSSEVVAERLQEIRYMEAVLSFMVPTEELNV